MQVAVGITQRGVVGRGGNDGWAMVSVGHSWGVGGVGNWGGIGDRGLNGDLLGETNGRF